MIHHSIGNDMLSNVAEFLSTRPIDGTDEASLEDWSRSCIQEWCLLAKECLTAEEYECEYGVLCSLLDAQIDLARQVATKKHSTSDHWSTEDRTRTLEALLNRPQIEQRTEAWYLDAIGLLSASQFNTILKSGRTRGQLVLQKASKEPPDLSQRKTCVMTSNLNPFTWGIRFEPIVKQIYEHLTATSVTDLGRLKHQQDPRLAASPDGLVIKGPPERLARFVEFKAPVTRKILKKVPEDYMAQMQIQMEVGNVEECDYLEVKFESAYGSKIAEISDVQAGTYYGVLYVLGKPDEVDPVRYAYSPLNTLQWLPDITENEVLLEKVYWKSNEWYTTTIGRSRSWFASVQPAIQRFWEDVEKARKGEYELPASTRKVKEPKCLIVSDASIGKAESVSDLVSDAPECTLEIS